MNKNATFTFIKLVDVATKKEPKRADALLRFFCCEWIVFILNTETSNRIRIYSFELPRYSTTNQAKTLSEVPVSCVLYIFNADVAGPFSNEPLIPKFEPWLGQWNLLFALSNSTVAPSWVQAEATAMNTPADVLATIIPLFTREPPLVNKTEFAA